jgi:pyridoxal phosphate enzyme (YggS family)
MSGPGIWENYQAILRAIDQAATRSGRTSRDITLIAVSKTVGLDHLRQALAAGISLFGENYVQEALEKYTTLKEAGFRWHMIGHLQRNKVKYIVEACDCIHSVDNLKLAEEIDLRAGRAGKIMPILLEVNLAGEASKSGIHTEAELLAILEPLAHLANIRLTGLMTMPPFFDEPELARPYFRRLRELRDRINTMNLAGCQLTELSMGMSGDFEVAVEEGATMVRVGSAIFGARG